MIDRRNNPEKDRRSSGKNTNFNAHMDRRSKYAPKERRLKNNTNFSQQNVTLSNTPLFFPEGFEKLFFGLYFISLPYVMGLLFLFLYVASGKLDLFLSLNKDSSFLLTWAIGYEIIAVFILLYIIKKAFGFSL
jgi:hypothetical protein